MTTSDAPFDGYDITRDPTSAFVFADVPGEGWVPAAAVGVGETSDGRPTASFTYGRRWSARKDAFSFDPVNLPLGLDIPSAPALPAALRDAAPDGWGRRLLADRFQVLLQAANERAGRHNARRRLPSLLDQLLLSGEDRVGALAFGPTRDGPLIHDNVVPVRSIRAMEAAMCRYDDGQQVERDVALLAAGTSLGGARPKATVQHADGTQWLAKFMRSADTFGVIRAEHAMMTLARVAGVDVAETRVVSFGKREALLVRRFDRIPQADGSQTRLPFVSALSLLGLSETDLGGSYPEIADAMRKAGCPAEDLRQLFRRMVVNVACGNTDDHLKNHGFRLLDGRWRLTPAYDIVPSPDGMDIQAIGVGVLGSTPCYSNVLSKAGRFGVPHEEAVAIVQEVVAVMSTWREHFEQCRVPTVDIKRLERCIGRMQERHMATARVPAP